MPIVYRYDPTPGFLAPRVSFDVVVEAYAEQLFEQQVHVYLGQNWYWYRPRNWLIHAPEWGKPQQQPKEVSAMGSNGKREQEQEVPWTALDDWLFAFATTRLS